MQVPQCPTCTQNIRSRMVSARLLQYTDLHFKMIVGSTIPNRTICGDSFSAVQYFKVSST